MLFLSCTSDAGNLCIHLHVSNTGLSHGRADSLHGCLYTIQELREIAARSRHFTLLRQHKSRQRHTVRVHDVSRRHRVVRFRMKREGVSKKREVATETNRRCVPLYKGRGNISGTRYRRSENRNIGVFVLAGMD